jgi:hypothetical protein
VDLFADVTIWLWIGFGLLVFGLLALDLGVLHREARAISVPDVNAGEKMHRRAGVKMHHGTSSQRPVQLHIPL